MHFGYFVGGDRLALLHPSRSHPLDAHKGDFTRPIQSAFYQQERNKKTQKRHKNVHFTPNINKLVNDFVCAVFSLLEGFSCSLNDDANVL